MVKLGFWYILGNGFSIFYGGKYVRGDMGK